MSHKYDESDPTSWKDLLLPKDAHTQRLLVAALKLVQAAKETTRLPDGSLPPIFPAGDLVFELAKLHTSTMGRLADIASKQATKMLEHTQEARTGRRGYGGHTMQVLVQMTMPANEKGKGQMTLRNKSSAPKVFAVPDVAELVLLKDGKRCDEYVEYTNIEFAATDNGSPLEHIEVCAKTLQKPGEKLIFLSMPNSDRILNGRYRSCLILESTTAGPPAEIIVDLVRSGGQDRSSK